MKKALPYILAFAAIIGLVVFSVNKSKERAEKEKRHAYYKAAYERQHPFEKYLYQDTSMVVHRKNDCIFVEYGPVKYIDTVYLQGLSETEFFCQECFSKDYYEKYRRLYRRARKRRGY